MKWDFAPNGSANVYPIDIRADVGRQLPKDVKCCSGTYLGTLNRSLHETSANNSYHRTAILIPLIFGLKEVSVDHRKALETSADYSAGGPIIDISDEESARQSLVLEIRANIPPGLFPSLWSNPFRIGEHDDLLEIRDRSIGYQRYLPLVQAGIFLLIALALISNRLFTGYADVRLSYFIQALFAWAAFYFSLSGLLRYWSPMLGGYSHFILRGFAGLSSVRLLMAIMDIPQKKIKSVSIPGLIAIALGAILSLGGDHRYQVIGYVIISGTFAITLFLIKTPGKLRTENDSIQRLVYFSALVYLAGNLSDGVKLLGSYFFNYRSHIPFINRFTDAPLVLTSIFYLVNQASKRAQAELKSETVKEMSDQVLHDLRSPVSTIRNLVAFERNSGTSKLETLEQLESACERIVQMCNSLRERRSAAISREIQFKDIRRVIEDIIPQKHLEFGETCIFFHYEEGNFFTDLDEFQFKRTISNLLNNSYEAKECNFRIDISLSQNKSCNVVTIKDNGKGLPLENTTLLTERGKTFGKLDGLGLGLFSALKKYHRLEWDHGN